MLIFKFTKSAIQDLPIPEGDGRVEYADSIVTGLCIRITSNGSKSFYVVRKRGGKFFRVTLGKFPDLTVDQAREQAAITLGEVAVTRRNPNNSRRENLRASRHNRQNKRGNDEGRDYAADPVYVP